MSTGDYGLWRDDWEPPTDVVRAMATGASTARLNRKQRTALLILLLRSEKSDTRHKLHNELVVAHAARKKLTRELDEMRKARDRERKRAERAEARMNGRIGCGKVPLRDSAEAWLFVEKICSATGENLSDYNVYTCDVCEPRPGMAIPHHIGHVRTRAERERETDAGPVDVEMARQRLRIIDG